MMEPGGVREQQGPASWPAGASGDITEMESYVASVVSDVLRKRREMDDLEAKTKERKLVLETLHQHVQMLQNKVEEVEEFSQGIHMFIKDDHVNKMSLKAMKEQEEALEKEAEIQRLKAQRDHLVEKQQQLQQLVQRHNLYGDFLEEVVKMTKFEDAQLFMAHVKNLLHLRQQLSEKEEGSQKDVEERKKALQTLEDQHHLTSLHTNVQLSQLHRELDEMCSETLTWESKWNHILETVAKKTIMLVKIKLVTLNLYELIKDKIEEEEFMNMAETGKQLDKVKMFVHDYSLAWTKLLREQNGTKKEPGKNYAVALETRLSLSDHSIQKL